ncbi:MAG: 23S rRNA (adenine(2503)-C(2))-methyltransferase RlmN, partial [Bacteroidales bacterium]
MLNKSLLGLSPEELKEIVVGLGLPAFTAKQIAGWIYGKHVDSIDK